MALITTDDKHYHDIATRIRNQLGFFDEGEGEVYLPSEMPKKIDEACDYSYDAGYDDGAIEGIKQGKQAQYDEFWDAYQNNGVRADYSKGFPGSGWKSSTFIPKYDMMPIRCDDMFHYTTRLEIDLAEHLEQLGIVLDTSKSTNVDSMFMYCYCARVGVLDLSSAKRAYYMFAYSKMHTIDKIILPLNNTLNLASAFMGCTSLKNLTIEGVIQSNFDVKSCPLTADSMKSIISCLANYADTGNEFVYTVQFNETCWAALEASGASPSGGTWTDYVESLGWLT